ncbi:MAG TPA: M56 family metallopeptidase [Conexibacter sp.]|jgi:hypothetical protein
MRARSSSVARLHVPIALLGVLATVAAAVAVLEAFVLGPTTAHAIEHADEPLLLHVLLDWPLPLALSALVGIVAMRCGRVLGARLRAQRRIARGLVHARATTLCGEPVGLLDDSRPAAFCAGLLRPRVYVTTGAASRLGDGELRALLAHERHHARRRDPLRSLVRELLVESLFFLPVLRPLTARRATVDELRADAAAVAACGGDVRPVAGALLAFGGSDDMRGPSIDPERVDQLGGVRRAWRAPRRALSLAVVALACAFAMALLAFEHGAGRAADPRELHTLASATVTVTASVVLLCAAVAARVQRRRRPLVEAAA